jgi:hypothetical protein
MEELTAIVERVIAEHKIILADFKSMENVANDASAMKAMEKGKAAFMPSRLNPAEGLKQLEPIRIKLDKGLNDHFKWEENTLLDAFNEHKAMSLIPTLKTLMSEHGEIREGLGELKGLMEELHTEEISFQIWQTKGYDLRAYMTNLQKKVQTHAANEQRLLNNLLKEVSKD